MVWIYTITQYVSQFLLYGTLIAYSIKTAYFSTSVSVGSCWVEESVFEILAAEQFLLLHTQHNFPHY